MPLYRTYMSLILYDLPGLHQTRIVDKPRRALRELLPHLSFQDTHNIIYGLERFVKKKFLSA